ncbi:MAG TPA: NADH-quinone oxidoreductase subunit M [Verrucomicrobiae bacterium]|jgi:NADH-quinone oxidoreductase subunit M|nr:NADH-quinone oxidoreductase subunit M [Verrucomicrobiae bacterium]
MTTLPLLTGLIALPLAGGIALLLTKPAQEKLARAIGLATSLLALLIVGVIWSGFDRTSGGMQWVEQAAWAPSIGIEYHLGVDGISLLMLLLTTLLVPFSLLASWKISRQPKLYFALTLFLESGLLGTFTALNFIHWFLFWELSLIPAFFLIKIWGGPKAGAAAFQFFLYTMVGSVALLVAFLAIYAATNTFDFGQLAGLAAHGEIFGAHQRLAGAIFLAALLGFAVKVPLLPFHSWLPAAYAEAPTGASMLLTGAMSKMGVYGFLRILLPIFPEQMRAAQTPLLWLAVATIVFPAAAAFAQRDLKRMVAYSSINHLGYCLLGIIAATRLTPGGMDFTNEKAAALNGVVLQMFSHGLTAAALFYFVGLIEERAGGLRCLHDFGGLRQVAPVFCGLMGITVFASLGLPGLGGFVGEFLIFKGALPLASWAAAIATLGLLFTAIFLLTILQRVFAGPLPGKWSHWRDLSAAERWCVAPVIGLIFILGILPQAVLDVTNPTVLHLLQQF